MNYRSDGPLHQRLDRLEDKGRGVLTAAARRAAWSDAMGIAARASIVVPLVLLGVALVRPVAVLPAVLVCLAVPLIVLAAVYATRAARIQVERGAALALVDRALALKDRVATTAEFAGSNGRDGFRDAAMQEAEPWLDRAAAMAVSLPAAPAPRHRHWLFPVVAALALIAALSIHRAAPGVPERASPTPLRRIALALGLRPTVPNVAAKPTADADRSAGVMAQVGSTNRIGTDAGDVGRAQTAGGAADGGAGDADAASRAAGAAGEAAASPAAPGPMGGAGAGAKAGAAANATLQAGTQPDARQEAATLDARDAETAAAVSRATAAKSAANGAAATPSLAAAPPAAPRNAGGNDGQQGGTSRKRDQSGQQSSGPGSRGNNSQQGSNRGTGQEGIKRARGSSSQMLAVPMEDRVIGTVNAGSVSSTTRNAPPRAMSSGIVAAQSRGNGQAQAGRILHGARTVQEDRMLERYFRRAGVDR
ncbi:hypothetical protein [uncultured Sphingomonas sp.]|uniref:hypothetical protein n=1 Tax=uncultured Sphingomonas sp. TaxID=158754 RepID=UPI0025D8AA04|nr:hypothetical protein [uncultured Sphingomonas sp.]